MLCRSFGSSRIKQRVLVGVWVVRFCPVRRQARPLAKPESILQEPNGPFPAASFPGLEVSLGKLLEHGLVELVWRWPTIV